MRIDADTKELLVQGRQRLTEYGWCQKRLQDLSGRCCALGSMLSTGELTTKEELRAYRNAERALIEAAGEGWFSVVDWNDVPGRTFEEIIAGFDKAIAS